MSKKESITKDLCDFLLDRKEFISIILQQLIRLEMALEDDILAEQAAINLYQSHIDFFKGESGILQNETGFIRDMKKMKYTKEQATQIYQLLDEIILSPEESEDGIGSIQHIMNEEIEHKKEFEKALNKLRELINKIK